MCFRLAGLRVLGVVVLILSLYCLYLEFIWVLLCAVMLGFCCVPWFTRICVDLRVVARFVLVWGLDALLVVVCAFKLEYPYKLLVVFAVRVVLWVGAVYAFNRYSRLNWVCFFMLLVELLR